MITQPFNKSSQKTFEVYKHFIDLVKLNNKQAIVVTNDEYTIILNTKMISKHKTDLLVIGNYSYCPIYIEVQKNFTQYTYKYLLFYFIIAHLIIFIE